ncbi:hypothetical protein N665_0436s0046 [Sinapis alba]|nr:hypothetical protein N665_0436s0046 [Sinapis alba]
MESLGRLKIHRQPCHHLSFTHTSSSFPKQSSTFRPLIRPNSPFRCASIKASSSSKSPNIIIPLQKSSPFRLFKSTCITLTTAAVLLSLNLQLKSPVAIAAPMTPPVSMESSEHVTLEEKERALEEHLATHPSDVDSLRSLMEKAKCFLYSGDTETAKTLFEEVLAKDPLCVEAYHGLVMAYSNADVNLKEVESRIEEAMLRCKMENNKHNEHREFKHLVAQIRVVRGKYNEALKLYEELVEDEPGDFWPYFCQGVIYILLNKEDKAEEQYDKFKKLVPENYNYMEDFLVNNLIAREIFSAMA